MGAGDRIEVKRIELASGGSALIQLASVELRASVLRALTSSAVESRD
jgi:hypothetical protein